MRNLRLRLAIYHILLGRGSFISVVTVHIARLDLIPCGSCIVADIAGTTNHRVLNAPSQFSTVGICLSSSHESSLKFDLNLGVALSSKVWTGSPY